VVALEERVVGNLVAVLGLVGAVAAVTQRLVGGRERRRVGARLEAGPRRCAGRGRARSASRPDLERLSARRLHRLARHGGRMRHGRHGRSAFSRQSSDGVCDETAGE
jgi:hypothetical protein